MSLSDVERLSNPVDGCDDGDDDDAEPLEEEEVPLLGPSFSSSCSGFSRNLIFLLFAKRISKPGEMSRNEMSRLETEANSQNGIFRFSK